MRHAARERVGERARSGRRGRGGRRGRRGGRGDERVQRRNVRRRGRERQLCGGEGRVGSLCRRRGRGARVRVRRVRAAVAAPAAEERSPEVLVDGVEHVALGGAAQHCAFAGREAEFGGHRSVRVAVVARDAAAAAARTRRAHDVQLGESAAGARAVVQQRRDAARALGVRVHVADRLGTCARRAPLQSGRNARVRRRAAAGAGREVLRRAVARRVL